MSEENGTDTVARFTTDLLVAQCGKCEAPWNVVSEERGWIFTVEVRHKPGCPMYLLWLTQRKATVRVAQN
ncbi:hypothetical protein ACFV10_10435 [Streptomyces cyaneofuscatus]|uniref:hypothetical protein n=1 Tax=Streptomyces cyaneofuscatus TaxID=66883 RepID=UPI0036CD7FE6